MSLIQCTECSAQVSDKAASCPHCGAPVSDPEELIEAAPEPTQTLTSGEIEDKTEVPRWLAVVILVLAIPAFSFRLVLGVILLILAYNFWTNFGKRSLFLGNRTQRTVGGRLVKGAVAIVVIIFVGFMISSIRDEARIEKHLAGTWLTDLRLTASDFGPEMVEVWPSLIIGGPEEWILSPSERYTSSGAVFFQWRVAGHTHRVDFDENSSGKWELSGSTLTMTEDSHNVSDLVATIDGRFVPLSEGTIGPGTEEMTFRELCEPFLSPSESTDEVYVEEIDSVHMKVRSTTETGESFVIGYRKASAAYARTRREDRSETAKRAAELRERERLEAELAAARRLELERLQAQQAQQAAHVERDRLVRVYGRAVGQQLMDKIMGGQDLIVQTGKWYYDSTTKELEFPMDVSFNGNINRSNHYQISGVLTVNEDGSNARFARLSVNERYADKEQALGFLTASIVVFTIAKELSADTK